MANAYSAKITAGSVGALRLWHKRPILTATVSQLHISTVIILLHLFHSCLMNYVNSDISVFFFKWPPGHALSCIAYMYV